VDNEQRWEDSRSVKSLMNRWLIAAVILGVAGLEFTFPGADSKAGADDEDAPQAEHMVALRTAGANSDDFAHEEPPATLVDRIAEFLK